MRTSKLFVFMAFCVWCATYQTVQAISILPTDEGYVTNGKYGSGPYQNQLEGLFAGKIDHVQSGDPNLPTESQIDYEFDISSLLFENVGLANFTFTVNDPSVGGKYTCFDLNGCPVLAGINISGYAGDGSVKTSDFNIGNFLTTINPLPSFGSLVTINATQFIQELLNDGNQFAGFNISAASFNGTTRLTDASLSVTTGTPSAVPEPASLTLLGIGLSGLGFMRRRIKKISI